MLVLRRLALIFCVVGASLTLGPGGAVAQTSAPSAAADAASSTPDYKAWEVTAARAEEATQAARASTLALEQLRAELVDWRRKFFAVQNDNTTRIKSLQDQIAALGAPPADGATEAAEIADRRAALNQQLATQKAPGLAADEAYRRADGLISEIDGIIRERQANALMQLGPTPLNPANWSAGIGALGDTLRAVIAETSGAWSNPVVVAGLRQNAPTVLFYLAIAAVLLLRGRRWMERLTLRLVKGGSRRGAGTYAAVISLGQMVLPYVGLLALMQAIHVAGILGLRGGRIAELVPAAGLIVIFALWLGNRTFPAASVRAPVFNLSPERAAEARLIAAGLGLVLALNKILVSVADYGAFSAEVRVTLGFPLLVAAGVLLFRLGRILLTHVRTVAAGDDDHRYRNTLVRLIARLTIAVAVAGPVLAAVGYFQAASFISYPAISSLALIAALVLMQRFVDDLYGLVTGQAETAGDALIPVLLGFVLGLAALPVLALIWGARVSDLTELWTRFTEGFQIGSNRISPSNFMTFAVIFAIGYMGTRLLQGGLRASVLPKTKIDVGGQHAILSGVGYIGVILAAIIAISAAGIDLSSLAIVAGALSVGIGFGLQNIVSNFVSGIILLIERPVSEGDWIEVGGVMGTVRRISVRSTRVETFDRTDVIVPNSDLITSMVTNWTRSNLTGRIILKVGVAYGTDTRRVQAILGEIAQAHPIVILNPPPNVTFMGFGADSLDFEVRVLLSDINFGLTVRSELNHEIARRFGEEGIEIPFAQRDVWLRNPETLRGETAPAPAATPGQTRPAERDDPDPDSGPDTDR